MIATEEGTLAVRFIEAQMVEEIKTKSKQLGGVCFPLPSPTYVSIVDGVLIEKQATEHQPCVADIRSFYDPEEVSQEDLDLIAALRADHAAHPPVPPQILPMR